MPNNSILYKDYKLINKNLISRDIDHVKFGFNPILVNFMNNLFFGHKFNSMTLQLYTCYNNSDPVTIDNLKLFILQKLIVAVTLMVIVLRKFIPIGLK